MALCDRKSSKLTTYALKLSCKNKLSIDPQEVQAILYVVYICICVFLSSIYVKSDQQHKYCLRVSVVNHDYSMFDIQATIFKSKLYKASALLDCFDGES